MPLSKSEIVTKLGVKGKFKGRILYVRALNGDNTGHASDGAHHLVEVLLVVDLDRYFDQSDIFLRHIGACIANSRLDLCDRIRDTGEHSRAILGRCEQLDGLDLAVAIFRPFDVDDTVAVDHQLPHVLAPLIVHNNALPERDVTDNVLASQRIAASRSRYQQILDALDADRIFAEANELLNGLDAGRNARR